MLFYLQVGVKDKIFLRLILFLEKGMFFSPYVYSVDSLLENIGR